MLKMEEPRAGGRTAKVLYWPRIFKGIKQQETHGGHEGMKNRQTNRGKGKDETI